MSNSHHHELAFPRFAHSDANLLMQLRYGPYDQEASQKPEYATYAGRKYAQWDNSSVARQHHSTGHYGLHQRPYGGPLYRLSPQRPSVSALFPENSRLQHHIIRTDRPILPHPYIASGYSTHPPDASVVDYFLVRR